MKIATTLILALVLTLASIHTSSAQQEERQRRKLDVQALLSRTSFPKGIVIRVHADMFGSKSRNEAAQAAAKEGEARVEKRFSEAWEFTSDQVHRVVIEYGKKETIYRRVESRAFDTKDIWLALTDGTPLKIEARKGKGEEVMFAGTDFIFGGRSIEIVRDGELLLDLCEHCAGAGYPEEDAWAFAALYERLATPARALFRAKAGNVNTPSK